MHQAAKLLPSDGTDDFSFGSSVAVSELTVYAAAPGKYYLDVSGSAYVFERPGEGWSGTVNETVKLVPTDLADDDAFGCSVAASGNTVVVGACRDDDSGDDSGSAYLFLKPHVGWSGTINEAAKLLPSDGAEDDQFGQAVAVAGDTAVVGANRDDDHGYDTGSVYVFHRPGAGWAGTVNQVAKLLASDGPGQPTSFRSCR
jgi:hypothetical protein